MAESNLILASVRDLAIARYRTVRMSDSPHIDLPKMGRSTLAGEIEYMWRSPSVWWAKSRTRKVKDIVESLDRPDFAIDYSDAVTTFLLSGTMARGALLTGCPIDLRPLAFPAGSVAATRLDLFDIVLHARQAERFDIHVARSYAEDAKRWLEDVVSRLRRSN